jgi:hypothetical protein
LLPPAVDRYLRTRTLGGPWRLEGCDHRDFTGAVVIPALAEEADLFSTLETLFSTPPGIRNQFLIVVVVNHRAEASASEKENNRRTLRRLGELVPQTPLAWVDAAAPWLEIPPSEGVGTARRIGCDLALERLNWVGNPPLLAWLDADTPVRSDYFGALLNHFAKAPQGAAVVPFAHQKGDTAQQQRAIVRYELFLRSYVLGLFLAQSPYAFHTVGSTIVCRADAYVRAGGMNRRVAGEDFYFLQQMAKTCGVAPLSGTVVFPSARPSARTPFGTGRSVGRQLAGEEAVTFYHPDCFRLLGEWLRAATQDDPIAAAHSISPEISTFLHRERFPQTWEKLRKNNRAETLQSAFHQWFDALKTIRLIHYLSAGPFPRCEWAQALRPLLEKTGNSLPGQEESALDLLRRLQGVR